MTTKIDRINGAYSQMRISGLTVQPTPEDTEIALDRLENMMAEFEGRNICLDYNFELEPDPNSLINVKRTFWHMIETNLAIRLVPDFNKIVPQTLINQANSSFSTASGNIAAQKMKEVDYPRRMPRGSGNTLRFNRWQRYQRPQELPPTSCETNDIIIGDINDYVESFRAYLNDAETIASFTIEADPGLELQSNSNDDPVISYRVKALDNSTQGVWQQVKIVVTTSSGRKETRKISFQILPNVTVGSSI